MVSPASGPSGGSSGSGSAGRTLQASSYHQALNATKGKKRLPHQDRSAPPSMKRSKLSNGVSAAAGMPPAAVPSLAALSTPDGKAGSGKGPSTPGFKRGIYLAFVDNALQEKKKGRPDPYNELVTQFKSQTSVAASSSSLAPSTPQKPSTPGTTNLKALIEALTHVVAQLDRSHSALVDSILSLPWTAMDDNFVKSHSRFVRALLTTRSEFVQMALEKIVKGFRFQQAAAYAAELPGQDAITRRQSYERLHALLSSLIYLIPTLPSTLWPLLNKYFPHKRESRNAQVVYISNALRIVEYSPQLGENVLGAVIMRALQIDVEIQIDIEDLEDDEGVLDEEVFGFSMDNPFDRVVGDEDDSDDDSDDEDAGMNPDELDSDFDDSSDEEDMAEQKPSEEQIQVEDGENADEPKAKVLSPKVVKRLKEMAAKLDAILRVLFDFLQRIRSSSPSLRTRPGMLKSASQRTLPGSPIPFDSMLDSPRTIMNNESDPADYLASNNHALVQNMIYRVLLAVFDERILRTFQTRHTQFILFWYASLSPEFADEFTGTLLSRVLNDSDTPTVTRVASAAYVASFVSRSTSIDGSTARQVMSLLCQCLDSELEQVRYITAQLGQVSGAQADRIVKSSVVFYAVAQAAFYIFCFRWRDFLDESEEELDFLEGVPAKRRWMLELESLKMAVNSPLNPLKMCAPAVVSQFARMAHKTDFMFCHSIIEQNKRQSRSQPATPLKEATATPLLERPMPVPPAGPARTASQTAVQAIAEHTIVQQTLKEAQLDSHFPFDPYKLPLSAQYIQGIYQDWNGGGFDDEESADEDDDQDDVDDDTSTEGGNETRDEDEDSSMQASSADSDAILMSLQTSNHPRPLNIKGVIDPTLPSDGDDDNAAFSQSFEAMSVSPRHGHSHLFGRS